MTTETLPTTAAAARVAGMPAVADGDVTTATPAGRIQGLRCRNCQRLYDLGPSFVCAACFGPLEVAYDLASIAGTIDRATIAARAPGIWRYLELLPVESKPARALAVGSTPLIESEALARRIGVARLHLKDDSRNPTLSFKDRAVALATAKALDFGFEALACASTGNLAGATAAAAAKAGLPAYVFIPADLEPEKVEHALAYGATVVPIDGTYDDVNRLCLELTDELPWAFVNVNLRPFYAEGSRTLAFEIAEGLGWRSPDVVVAPIASGALFTKIARGFRELAAIGLIEARPIRFVGAQAAGCAPVANAFAAGADEISPVQQPDTIVRSLAIGSPADGRYALELARASGGSVEGIADEDTATAIRTLASTEGIYVETAGGVTFAAAEQARRHGVIRPDDEVAVLLTGNGLKTPAARTYGLPAQPARPGQGGLAPAIPPSFSAFERWLADA
jgi:threonine synthase